MGKWALSLLPLKLKTIPREVEQCRINLEVVEGKRSRKQWNGAESSCGGGGGGQKQIMHGNGHSQLNSLLERKYKYLARLARCRDRDNSARVAENAVPGRNAGRQARQGTRPGTYFR